MIKTKNYIILNNDRLIEIKNVECFCNKNYYFTAFFDGEEHFLTFNKEKFFYGVYDNEEECLIYGECPYNITELHLETIIKEDK